MKRVNKYKFSNITNQYSKRISEVLCRKLLELEEVGRCPLDEFSDDDPDDTVYYRFKYVVPTYGQVLDWLEDRGYVIKMTPFWTYALKNHVAYTYIIFKIGEGAMDEIYNEERGWRGGAFGGSIVCQLDDAVGVIVDDMKKSKENFVD